MEKEAACEMVRQQILVSGKVQGVGFRKFVEGHAVRLHLFGYCKNLSSGEVEIHVEGHSEKVHELIGELRIGPPRARVDNIVNVPTLTLQNDTSFVILD